ncbi:DUF2332 family protein [Actinoplanes derwentensis]|uniref:DUF2332 domain-containing protein n=1 Tax=Actinoplanes derwentensis TaxID=113562 RepID=A0A1H1WXM9_9ACTN|nr:DUF2332 family protein [Actinoplanes derwentensis]GID86959.1 hypothetical protein Ade03nite_58830 [Actinoplanes derwentensis]SDT01106.1 hypothetical protein SAMN04489716_2248 [Actinoplanes derwentensis]
MTTAELYADFATREARGVSPVYERLALAVAADTVIHRLLAAVPVAKRQPNLLFAVVRLLGGPVEQPGAFHAFTVTHWAAIEADLRVRATQTNEARLQAAAAVAAADPPELITGDLVDDLPALAAEAPPDATLVVFHTSVLYQVPADRRAAFIDLAGALPGHWISAESPEVVPFDGLPPTPDDTSYNVVTLDGRPLAWSKAHGQSVRWFG